MANKWEGESVGSDLFADFCSHVRRELLGHEYDTNVKYSMFYVTAFFAGPRITVIVEEERREPGIAGVYVVSSKQRRRTSRRARVWLSDYWIAAVHCGVDGKADRFLSPQFTDIARFAVVSNDGIRMLAQEFRESQLHLRNTVGECLRVIFGLEPDQQLQILSLARRRKARRDRLIRRLRLRACLSMLPCRTSG